jgi:small subunit ribosomal protein S20
MDHPGADYPDPFMANIKSQIKRNRQNAVREARNKSAKSELRTRVKAVRSAVAGSEDVSELMRSAQKEIDQAVSKGRLHPRTAARRKSRLAKAINNAPR